MSNTINDSKRYIAYICPACSETNRKNINIFKFSSASPLRFSCSVTGCGEECFSISRMKDKFKLTIECPVCGDVHTFKVSSQHLLFKDLVSLSCPESGINIFFAGQKEKVEKAVSENLDKFSELTEQFDLFTEEMTIIYKIIDKLHSLISKEKVVCSSCGCTDVLPDIDNGEIILICKNCENAFYMEIDEDTLKALEKYDGFKF